MFSINGAAQRNYLREILERPRESDECHESFKALEREVGRQRAFAAAWSYLVRKGQRNKALSLFFKSGYSVSEVHDELVGLGEESPAVYRHLIGYGEEEINWPDAVERMHGEGTELDEVISIMASATVHPRKIGEHTAQYKASADNFAKAASKWVNDDELHEAMTAAGFSDAQYYRASAKKR